MLQRLFRPRPAAEAGRALFRALSAQARQPVFYASLGVADTVEGRFELYVLHLALVLRRLKGEGAEAGETSQATFDAFLKNLDEGLRDMGVGDLSVGKKMRRLGEAIYGRLKGYDRVLAEPGPQGALEEMVGRTLLEGRSDPARAAPLARYVLAAATRLKAQPLAEVLAARLDWPEVEHG
jgi:cytochrome b pre-mRNA-processing protein 3